MTASTADLIVHIPPHDLDAEAAVLGACLLDPEAIPRVVEILDAEHFYARANGRIFATIRCLFDGGTPPDAVTVRDALARANALDDVGGAEALVALVGKVESAANVESWATIVLDHAIRRRVLIAADDLRTAARRGDSAEQLAEIAQRAVGETEFAGAARTSFVDMLEEAFAAIDAPCAQRGVPTLYGPLDELLGGFHPGSLNLLGARPSMGKSTLALNIAVNVALMGVPVGFLSLEMGAKDLTRKALAIRSGVAEKRMRGGHLLTDPERAAVNDAAAQLRHAPLFVEGGDFTTTTIRAKIRSMRFKHAVELVIVDYLGLVRAPSDVRTIRSTVDLVTHVSGSLKGTAVGVGVPILALCQLSRANARENEGLDTSPKGGKDRPIRLPGLTDLRDSGSLEQDADSVLFLHRDGYYTKDRTDTTAKVIVAKNRQGETGDVNLTWIPWCQRFVTSDPTR